jgi:AcrR family transcriptional regulator
MAVNRNASAGKEASARGPRPRRGPPELTRERILDAAATLFNRLGYHGTDSNSIAKEAGYATGTFYKHFRDKREAFLAVYERWVTVEWQAIEAEIAKKQKSEETARRIVDLTIEFHTQWRGLRASLMELIFADEEARRFFRAQRLRQLDTMAGLRRHLKLPARTREQDAIHLFMTERVFDAIGQGEIQQLGLDCAEIRESMVHRVLALLR